MFEYSENIKKLMNAYISFLKSEEYKKIEKGSRDSKRKTKTTASRAVVKVARRFAGFGFSLKSDIDNSQWYEDNQIEKIDWYEEGKRYTGWKTKGASRSAGAQFDTWLQMHCKASDTKARELWFFNNTAKCIVELTKRLDGIKISEVNLEDVETSLQLVDQATKLLQPDGHIGKILAQVKLLYSVHQENIPVKCDVLKYTPTAGFVKNMGSTDQKTLYEKLGDTNELKFDPSLALGDLMVNAVGGLIANIDTELETRVNYQQSCFSQSGTIRRDTKITFDSKEVDVRTELKRLAILKSLILNTQRHALKTLIDTRRNRKMVLAEVQAMSKTVEGIFTIVGGVVGVGKDGVRQMFENIGKGITNITEATPTLAVNLNGNKIEFLEAESSRLIMLTDCLIENYKTVCE